MKTERMPVGLAQVQTELEGWREGRQRGQRIPEEIWREAVRAVRQYGLHPVSRALRLDYYHLKRRAGGRQAQGHAQKGAGPVFVEMEGQRTEEGLACVVELEKGNGTRMRICVRDAVSVDWGKLKEAFLGA